MTRELAVIIPTLNEQQRLHKVIASIRREQAALELVIADGGSTDETVTLAQNAGCRVICAPAGRARQMNAGAAATVADMLLFLHADTLPPFGFPALIERELTYPGTSLGAFSLGIDDTSMALRAVARFANLRARLFGLPYGDQGLFMSRDCFEKAGGFPEIDIMEDFVFARKMRRLGRIVVLKEQAVTSARRWRNVGVVRTTLINQAIVCGYYAGISPNRLARWYRRARGVGGDAGRRG